MGIHFLFYLSHQIQDLLQSYGDAARSLKETTLSVHVDR